MRTNSLKTFVPHNFVFEKLKRIEIVPTLAHVGRSSWRVNFDIYDQDNSNSLVANVFTTMVATNDEHDASVPLPNRDALKKMVVVSNTSPSSTKQQTSTMIPFVKPPTTTTAIWQSHVRQTDCDSLGHINNSVYPLLCEDARSYAARTGQYHDQTAKQLATFPTSFCQVNYINQAKPFEPLRILSHFVNDEQHFYFEVISADVVVAELVVGVDTTINSKLSSKL